MEIDAKLALDVFKIDEPNHIQLEQKRCQAECEAKHCLYICPAKVYSLSPEGEILIRYEGCLECGACHVVCPLVLSWRYPRAGFGVQYRFG
jgi:ferredoxin like protein